MSFQFINHTCFSLCVHLEGRFPPSPPLFSQKSRAWEISWFLIFIDQLHSPDKPLPKCQEKRASENRIFLGKNLKKKKKEKAWGLYWWLSGKESTWQWTQVQSLGREDALEKEVTTRSSIPAWKIPWTEEPDGLQSMGSQRVGHDWATNRFYWSTAY